MHQAMEKNITIPTVLQVGPGVLSQLGPCLADAGLNKVCLFFGNGLIAMLGDTVHNSLQQAGVQVLSECEMGTTAIEDITDMAFSLPNDCQAVAGIGGGKVVDAAKYMGFLRKLPFISVPTSAGSDGFSSTSASLTVKGRRVSVPASMAFGIFADTGVMSTAPDRFLFGGIGDMVAKITSLYDWQFEEDAGVATVNDVAETVAKKAVNSFVYIPYETIHDALFLRELVNSLALSGIANEIAGGSAPTSGSEHLISHALDSFSERPQLHGVQVGVATYLMALVQNHRVERIREVFTKTGFFDHAATLGMTKADFEKAIDLAPSIKPYRHVYLHEEKYREEAKRLLTADPILNRILA